MNKNPYGMEQDDDAEDYSEAKVVNVTDEDVEFRVATTAGSKARRYRLAPFGQEGSTVHLQSGYTRPYNGAGRKVIRPIIETRTLREVYPAGPANAEGKPTYAAGKTLPMVVAEDRAPAARAAWLAEVAKKSVVAKNAKTVMVGVTLDPTSGQATAATITNEDDAGDAPVVASGPPASSAPKGAARGRA